MKTGKKGIDLIKEFEGFRAKPYRDAVGIPTIGYGNTYYEDGRAVKLTDPPITPGMDRGSQISRKMVQRVAPSEVAARSSRVSIPAMAL